MNSCAAGLATASTSLMIPVVTDRGDGPDLLAPERQNAYDLGAIKKWLEIFLYRFFRISQFKRSEDQGMKGTVPVRGGAPSAAPAKVRLGEEGNATYLRVQGSRSWFHFSARAGILPSSKSTNASKALRASPTGK